MFSEACALGEICPGALGFSVGWISGEDRGSAGCFWPVEGINGGSEGRPTLVSIFWRSIFCRSMFDPRMFVPGMFAPGVLEAVTLVLTPSVGDCVQEVSDAGWGGVGPVPETGA